jgi:quercetin dioxygenase-like cupin family protein
VKKGHSFLIPPNVVHSAKVGGKKEYVVVEVFSPTRPDLLKGEFAPEKSEE